MQLITVNMPESINNVTTNSAEAILDKYSDVFHGLGTLPGYVHLQTNPEVAPVQHTPRKMPVALKKEVKAKLDEMENKMSSPRLPQASSDPNLHSPMLSQASCDP